MSKKSAIGIFDSGIGGISIYNEIKKLLPNEKIVYLSDNVHAPYGDKSKKQINNYCIKNYQQLIRENCKLIVIACNTATTNSIDNLRKITEIPIVGVEPAIKPALLSTKTKVIGVLATEKTLTSSLFQKTSKKFTSNIKVIEKKGYGIVSMIEDGMISSKELKIKVFNYIKPMVDQNIDHLVLGCTHYYFLIPIIRKLGFKNIKILDSSKAVASRVKFILKDLCLLSEELTGKDKFFYNGKKNILKDFIGHKNKAEFLNF